MQASLSSLLVDAGIGIADDVVRLERHSPRWADGFTALKRHLRTVSEEARIAHIGSTAVRGIRAKPLLDVSIALRGGASLDEAAARHAGMVFRAINPEAVLFAIYLENGLRAANVHVRRRGDPFERWDLLWRDYLRAHPSVASEYVSAKIEATSHATERASYSRQKGLFIARHRLDCEAWASSVGWAVPEE